jgi:anti-sigma B factor antagonist
MTVYEEVALEDVDGWQVLRLAGEIDVATAPRLRDRLVALVTGGNPHLVVDLTGVEFIDSMGLGALVSGMKRARAHDGDLRLAGATDHVTKVLALTRLDLAFVTGDTVDEALAPEAEPGPERPAVGGGTSGKGV